MSLPDSPTLEHCWRRGPMCGSSSGGFSARPVQSGEMAGTGHGGALAGCRVVGDAALSGHDGPALVWSSLSPAVADTGHSFGWSSSCTLEVRRALALALGVEWDSVTELQATLHMHLEQTGVDVVTETTLQSVQYLHLEPTEITWASSMSPHRDRGAG